MGITFSITTSEKLERKLSLCAEEKGISRSRFVCDILNKWEESLVPSNKCTYHDKFWCTKFNISCQAPQHEAETCSGYSPKEI